MDPKKLKNKFKDLEMVPKKNRKNPDALKSAVKPQKSLKDIQQKYGVEDMASDALSENVGSGKAKDKEWTVGHFMPKNKMADSPLDEKLRMFDEDGNETAAQG
jgi:hypothetical protein